MIIQMTGHTYDFALSDVLRLFFGRVERPRPDLLSAGEKLGIWKASSIPDQTANPVHLRLRSAQQKCGPVYG